MSSFRFLACCYASEALCCLGRQAEATDLLTQMLGEQGSVQGGGEEGRIQVRGVDRRVGGRTGVRGRERTAWWVGGGEGGGREMPASDWWVGEGGTANPSLTLSPLCPP